MASGQSRKDFADQHPEQDPAEGSRETVERDLARQSEQVPVERSKDRSEEKKPPAN